MSINWTIRKVKLKDLTPSDDNPRTITDLKKDKLKRDVDLYGNLTNLIADEDGTLISGHQRYQVLSEQHGDDYEVDCAFPDRKLTEKERHQVGLRANVNYGDWDLERLDLLKVSKMELADLDIKFNQKMAEMKTPLPYYGGKVGKAPFICSLFRQHDYYVEPFAGGSSVFWHKELSTYSILNDRNKGVYSFWKFLKEDPAKLRKEVQKYALMHEQIYRDAKEEYDKGEVGIKLAAATFFMTRCGMGNSIGTFNLRTNKTAPRIDTVAEEMNIYAEKMQRCHIFNRDALSVIDLYKKRDAKVLFFIDPPYAEEGIHRGHYDNYSMEDYEKLLQKMEEIEGDFVATVGNTELCDKYVKKNGWHQVKQDTRSATSAHNKGAKGKFFVETIITNYEV